MRYLVMSSSGVVAVFMCQEDAEEYVSIMNEAIGLGVKLEMKEIKEEDVHEYF